MEKHQMWMHKALELAQKGRGFTSPNPMVGAVLVKDNKIIGEGYHQKFGGPHAEVWAIEQAGESANGSVLYVTLEPCCYEGKTPPCTNKIIKASISEVFVGMIDPNPRVNGGGVRQLKDAGIKVHVGMLEMETKELNRGFISGFEKSRPWITLKMAQTADGYIADVTGKSQWISSSDARNFVMEQRTVHDAIMVGMGTVFKDDPGLLPLNREGFIPFRIVLDDTLQIPHRMKLVSDEFKHRTVIITSSSEKDEKVKQLTGMEINIIHAPSDELGWIDIPKAMKQIHEFGINSIYSEGGSQVAGSLLQNKLVDEIQLIIAPKILGKGIPMASGFMKSLDSSINMEWNDVQMLGKDILLRGRLL